MRLGRIPGLRQVPSLPRVVDDRAVLFESWQGGCSDNPRAISERLRTLRPGYEQLWSADVEVPAGATRFPPDGRRYLRALGRAGFVVSNVSMPAYWRKPPGAKYVQTWHGTPLKRIAFDIEDPSFPGHRRHLARFARDVERWDYLISPNAFSTEVFRRAFRYEGEIVESGYPRNDALTSPGAAETRRAERAGLGIPDGATAILYAPTWRDSRDFAPPLDFSSLATALGEDHVILVRAHNLVADGVSLTDAGGRLLNVSHHPDIRELYLAADVLVTDYSSSMFDFAVTGKPMVFFTYDLAQYRDAIRGFYFDFEHEAPGPLVATASALAEALRAVDEVARAHAGAYAAFRERFCSLEDGRASDRVIAAVFPD
jgi:CDP-glycerol glycerophosphotransferase